MWLPIDGGFCYTRYVTYLYFLISYLPTPHSFGFALKYLSVCLLNLSGPELNGFAFRLKLLVAGRLISYDPGPMLAIEFGH